MESRNPHKPWLNAPISLKGEERFLPPASRLQHPVFISITPDL